MIDVVVVGAGPVGLMLAGELRLGGAEVVVVDRLAVPMQESRASTLHARTMEIFDERGLLDRLGHPPHDPTGHFGGIPLDLGAVRSRYAGQWKVPQTRVEQLLAGWALARGAEVRREHELVALTEEPDRVRLRLARPAGPVELTARFVVGCDGEDSTVRRLAGISCPGTPATQELLRADVAGIDVPDRRFERLPNGLAIAARRDGVTRVMVAPFGQAPVKRAGAPAFAEVCAAWAKVTGEDISTGEPLWLNAFGNGIRQATRYRRNRVLLAGDAAHPHMPIGGQALNLGLQDAVNLGWKLAAEVSGRAPARLLDTYHEERHAVGSRVLRSIEAQARLLLGSAELDLARELLAELTGQPAVRDLLAGTISGLDVRYERSRTPLVGARLPHVRLRSRTGPVGTPFLLRGGRGVLLDFAADPARTEWLRGALAGWTDRITVVPAVPPALPELAGLVTVLVRPDGYVAWVSGQPADPRPAIRRWFGRARRV